MDQRPTAGPPTATCIDYCHHSATPVGEMVLGGPRPPRRVAHRHERRTPASGCSSSTSGRTSRRDLADRDRIYLPREDMDRFGVARGRPAPARARTTARARAGGVRGRAGARRAAIAGAPLRRLVPRRVATRPPHVHAPAGWRCATRSRARATTRSPGARRRGGSAARASPLDVLVGAARGDAVTVEDAYERCRDDHPRARRATSTTGSSCCPTRGATAIYAAYAFSRRADDSVDDDGPLDAKLRRR